MSKKNETAVAEVENTNLASTSVGSIQIDVEDIDIPRINIVQKMSQIDAPVGAIVLNKAHVVAEAGDPVEAVVVATQKGWREDIPFDEDGIPRMAWSREQSDSIAADSEWDMVEFAEITLLLKEPKDNKDPEAFGFPIGGSNYAIGRINVSKNAYRSTFKRLATFSAFNKSIPLNSKVWTFTSEILSKGKYSWHNPSLTASSEKVDPAVTEFLADFGI